MDFVLGLSSIIEKDRCTMGSHGYAYAIPDDADKPVVASKGKVYTDAGYQTRSKIGEVIHKVKPLHITDTVVSVAIDEKVDDYRATLLCLLKILVTIPSDDTVKLYTDIGYIIKGVNAIGSKLMRSNKDLWEDIYDYIDNHKVMILSFNKLLNGETSDHTVGRKALITRARYLCNMDTPDGSYSSEFDCDTYWSNNLPRPKLPFSDLIYIANGPEDSNDTNILYSINKNKSLSTFGKKSVDCAYGVTIFKEGKPTVLTKVMDIITKDFKSDQTAFVAISLRTLYVDPGGVVSDLLKYGKWGWYRDIKNHLVRKTLTEKPLFHADTIPHMGWSGIIILNDIRDILFEFISGEHTKITGTRDITDFFYEKGSRKAHKKIVTAKNTLRIPTVKGRPRLAILGNEVPDKNTLLALVKDKEFKAHVITFGRHHAYVFETSVSTSICNNWYYSLSIIN